MELLHSNLSVNNAGHLCFAGVDTTELARTYGTPAYVMDEARIRNNCRLYRTAMEKCFGEKGEALYASKALSCKELYRIMAQEGMSTDLVSQGELVTALAAGFPPELAYFHGNNKTDREIEAAIDAGVGFFVTENREELSAISRIAGARGVCQKVLMRLTPGIDTHTHAYISTGKVDSKFGVSIETGQAEEELLYALSLPHLRLCGFHCHIGSQVFDEKPFADAAAIMLRFMAEMRAQHGYTAEALNLGGGFGVRYVDSDPTISIPGCIEILARQIKALCEHLGYPLPRIMLEPGRSIVADAGITLYTVGTVKEIPGYKNYVSVDGGMTDDPRYALYQAQYTVLSAGHMNDPVAFPCTVAGRCCESGDLIAEGVRLVRPRRGDVLAVLVTGAYNYSMASNYNRVPRPPIVMLREGNARVVVRRESLDDLLALDE